MKIFKFFMVFALVASCNVAERVERSLPNDLLAGPDLIQSTLRAVSARHPENKTLFDASVAQVVFPKIVRAGMLFGGTYREGYLVRDGIILSRVRLAGGNAGLNAGAQSYSQVVYILDDETLAAFRRGGKLSLHGTLNYARRGESVTNTFGKLSPTQPLFTTIFNQSGYLAGLSLDGTVMQLMQ
jgi:lipid-binding SYLF domain-containing protein